MSEYFDRSSQTLRDEALGTIRHHHYSPPQDVNQYMSRALPPPPPRRQSHTSSIYDPKEIHSLQHTPEHLSFPTGLNYGRKRSTFGGGIDEDGSTMVELPEIMIPQDSRSYEYPPLVSPRPQRPDSKLLSMWANGDELVSPLQTPAEASWGNHVVSPLSERSERQESFEEGRASMENESWFDDTSSDEEDEPDSSTEAPNESSFPDDAFSRILPTQLPMTTLRHSDPGSPLSPGLDWDFGEPGPDIGGLDTSGRQTVQPHMYAPSTHNGDEQSPIQDSGTPTGEPKITFALHRIDTFSSNRSRTGQLRVPPPLQLGEKSETQDEYVKTPYPIRTSSIPSQKANESSTTPQKRGAGLGRFGSLRRTSSHSIRKPPPGFTEILSQIDYQGTVSPVPRVKNILSKAKHGLGITRSDSKKEKKREELSTSYTP